MNNEGITKVTGGGAKFENFGMYYNEGTIEVKGAGSQLSNSGIMTNTGTITVSGGAAIILNSGTTINSGIISISGADVIIQNSGVIFNCGKIIGPISGNPPIERPDECRNEVEIDIKPNSDPNCFNNNGHGVIPVAILGSNSFDVTLVDPTTITLDDADVKLKHSGDTQASIEDINSDGFFDLVVKIEDIEGTYPSGETIAKLRGETFFGASFIGFDTICNTR